MLDRWLRVIGDVYHPAQQGLPSAHALARCSTWDQLQLGLRRPREPRLAQPLVVDAKERWLARLLLAPLLVDASGALVHSHHHHWHQSLLSLAVLALVMMMTR